MAFERMTEEVKNVSKLPNVITGQAASLKSTFDEAGNDLKTFINNFLTVLESAIAASNIGAMNGELESNLQAVIDTFSAAIADRYTKSEIDSKVAGDTNDLIKNLEIDLNTGIFTITKKDGTTQTIDTTLEKIPTNFAFVEENGTYYLRVTNTDGTSTQVDVTELFNDYTFNNSETVAFTTVKDGNKATITAEIRDASIGLEKLSLTAISQLEEYAAGANAAAQTATQKASEAKASADEALASANTAVSAANSAVGIEASALNSANSASTSASNSATYATEASTQATLSRSWAVGGTGSRTGEDTNNAKYWAEQARDSSQGGDMKKSTYDTNGDGVVDNAEKLGGQLPEYYAKSSDLASKQDVLTFDTTPTSGSNNPVTSGGVKSYVDERSVKVLEASTDNVIDFNTLTEEGIYLIKGANTDTTLNAPDLSNLSTVGSTSCDVTLEVRNYYDASGNAMRIEQNTRYLLRMYKVRIYAVSSTTWSDWSGGISPSEIVAGTLAGKVVANATAAATLSAAQVRNIQASTTDLTAGTSTLATGDIYFVFE